VAPFLASGDALRPDFVAFGNLRIEGDLLSSEKPVDACSSSTIGAFASRRAACHGAAATAAFSCSLQITHEPCRVVDCAVVLPVERRVSSRQNLPIPMGVSFRARPCIELTRLWRHHVSQVTRPRLLLAFPARC